ncbi:hypothetical protein [Peribacillus frigoritolerans]|nr:hypothetical protein [Peribacillus frigoritolerans]
MKQFNLQTVEAVTEALGANNMLDAVLSKLDAETMQEILSSIMRENGLGK